MPFCLSESRFTHKFFRPAKLHYYFSAK
jgi:hypothetical protein